MERYPQNALEELKRVEHLIYVSLKYTRTVDVIKSIIVRLIDACDALLEGIMEKLKEQGKITEIPAAPMVKCDLIKENFPQDQNLHSYLDLYLLLRKLNRADYTSQEEFRKHVTMTAYLEGKKEVKVDTAVIEDYYRRILSFVDYVKPILKNE